MTDSEPRDSKYHMTARITVNHDVIFSYIIRPLMKNYLEDVRIPFLGERSNTIVIIMMLIMIMMQIMIMM